LSRYSHWISAQCISICSVEFRLILTLLVAVAGCSPAGSSRDAQENLKDPLLFHLVQADLWQAAVEKNVMYFPPTYEQDGFTHATANPDLLINVANQFYLDVPGKCLCLRMTIKSLRASGVRVVFEGTASVGGKKEASFTGTDHKLFPHILGGIHPSTVLGVHEVVRSADGTFLTVAGVTR
jgi:uncharacterized protein (DUF952 family)